MAFVMGKKKMMNMFTSIGISSAKTTWVKIVPSLYDRSTVYNNTVNKITLSVRE